MKAEDLKKAFEEAKTSKVSMNINNKMLDMIDGLTKILGTSRTQTIDALISSGIKSQIEFTEKTWKDLIKQKEFVDKKSLINDKLKELKQFRKKWGVDTIPS